MNEVFSQSPETIQSFRRIFNREERLAGKNWSYAKSIPKDIFNITTRIMEVSKLGTVMRAYAYEYGMSQKQIAMPSIASHTEIMATVIDHAICFACDPEVVDTVYGYTYRELMAASNRHDLPENVIGDMLDDGQRDENTKRAAELKYWEIYSAHAPKHESKEFEQHVMEILLDMSGERKTPAGRLLHLADKFSAILEVLAYEAEGVPPEKSIRDRNLSEQDIKAMRICNSYPYGRCRASEMWLAVYLEQRKLNEMDDNGFFMAITIAATLMLKKWYDWREKEYVPIDNAE